MTFLKNIRGNRSNAVFFGVLAAGTTGTAGGLAKLAGLTGVPAFAVALLGGYALLMAVIRTIPEPEHMTRFDKVALAIVFLILATIAGA